MDVCPGNVRKLCPHVYSTVPRDFGGRVVGNGRSCLQGLETGSLLVISGGKGGEAKFSWHQG